MRIVSAPLNLEDFLNKLIDTPTYNITKYQTVSRIHLSKEDYNTMMNNLNTDVSKFITHTGGIDKKKTVLLTRVTCDSNITVYIDRDNNKYARYVGVDEKLFLKLTERRYRREVPPNPEKTIIKMCDPATYHTFKHIV